MTATEVDVDVIMAWVDFDEDPRVVVVFCQIPVGDAVVWLSFLSPVCAAETAGV